MFGRKKAHVEQFLRESGFSPSSCSVRMKQYKQSIGDQTPRTGLLKRVPQVSRFYRAFYLFEGDAIHAMDKWGQCWIGPKTADGLLLRYGFKNMTPKAAEESRLASYA